jgi:2'-5' RNA ligase
LTDVRAFVAIVLPESMLHSLTEQIDLVREHVPTGTIRWVRPENIHLTLKFLGNVSPDRLNKVKDSLLQVARGYSPFSLEVSNFGCFPNYRRPRTLWIGVHDSHLTLSNLHSELERSFEHLGFPKEGRSFHPHLTLGRVKRHVRGDQARKLGEELEEVKIGTLGRIEVEDIHLIRSDLRPTGAVYTELFCASLKGIA